MKAKGKVTLDAVEKLRIEAQSTYAPAKTLFSRQGAVTLLAEEIVVLRGRGLTWQQVSDWLRERGVVISCNALQVVIRRWKVRRDTVAAAGAPEDAAHKHAVGTSNKAPSTPQPRVGDAAVTVAPQRPPLPPPDKPLAPPVASAPAPPRSTEPLRGTFVMRPDTPDL